MLLMFRFIENIKESKIELSNIISFDDLKEKKLFIKKSY